MNQTVIKHPIEFKTIGDRGEFEGYASIFGALDRDGDIVEKGAFTGSLQTRIPALLWQHNPKEPIGRFIDVKEDNKGLYVRGKLSQTGRGGEAYELLCMGALDGLSIGFVTKEAVRDTASQNRRIKRADLHEISLVTFPANDQARVETVKSANHIATERDFERFLREEGFSRSQAKSITAKGFTKTEEGSNMLVCEFVDAVKGRSEALELKSTTTVPLGG